MTPNQECEQYYQFLLKRMDQRNLTHTTVYYLVKARAVRLEERTGINWKHLMPIQLTFLD